MKSISKESHLLKCPYASIIIQRLIQFYNLDNIIQDVKVLFQSYINSLYT